MPLAIVFGDVHLTTRTPLAVGADLARLFAEHPGERIVACGDLFDHSADRPDLSAEEGMRAALDRHPVVREAMARHLEGGGSFWLVAGNHDRDVGAPHFRGVIAGALGLGADAAARVRTTPWFFREGALHLEHGHLYDEDNAPEHPLIDGSPSLGVHFVRSFIAPTGAFAYLQANDDTPLSLFLAAFRWYGRRAPYVVYRYFRTAFDAMAMAGPFYRAGAERARGEAMAADFARSIDADPALAEAILAQATPSTLRSFRATVRRLYFDRVVATVSTASGLGALAYGAIAGRNRAQAVGALLVLGGMGWLIFNWLTHFDRFGGTVPERLRRGAERVRAATDAGLVVLGHAHAEHTGDGYANTGSFSFPERGAAGRPYLVIEGDTDQPRAVRRYIERTGN